MDTRLDYKKCVIVSRHQGAIQWLEQQIHALGLVRSPDIMFIKKIENATAEDIKGKIVFGNVPMHLAAQAAKVYAIEFDTPPRGAELTKGQMVDAGARLVAYTVQKDGEQEDMVVKAKSVGGVVDCTGPDPVVRGVVGNLAGMMTKDGYLVGEGAELQIRGDADIWNLEHGLRSVGKSQPARPLWVGFLDKAVPVTVAYAQ